MHCPGYIRWEGCSRWWVHPLWFRSRWLGLGVSKEPVSVEMLQAMVEAGGVEPPLGGK